VNDCHLIPIIGVKCDKFVTKSQAPTTPYGVPPKYVILRETQSPEKISRQPTYDNAQTDSNKRWE